MKLVFVVMTDNRYEHTYCFEYESKEKFSVDYPAAYHKVLEENVKEKAEHDIQHLAWAQIRPPYDKRLTPEENDVIYNKWRYSEPKSRPETRFNFAGHYFDLYDFQPEPEIYELEEWFTMKCS